jgi:hypothetical protein
MILACFCDKISVKIRKSMVVMVTVLGLSVVLVTVAELAVMMVAVFGVAVMLVSVAELAVMVVAVFGVSLVLVMVHRLATVFMRVVDRSGMVMRMFDHPGRISGLNFTSLFLDAERKKKDTYPSAASLSAIFARTETGSIHM